MANIPSVVNGWVKCDVNLSGKVAIITGANSGIGLETAIDLCSRDATVYMACRNIDKAIEAKNHVIKEAKCCHRKVVVKYLDLSSFSSVREFANDFNEIEERLDILINNAGVMLIPRSTTEDGYELQFQTHHLGHFLLTNLLLPKLKASAPSRIITVASIAHALSLGIKWDDLNHTKSYSQFLSYSDSKLMNILFTKELHRRLKGTGVTANCLHPGWIRSALWRNLFDGEQAYWRSALEVVSVPFRNAVWKTPKHGAQTSIYLAVAPEVGEISGKYFSNCTYGWLRSNATNKKDAERLWRASEEITQLQTETESEHLRSYL